MQATHRALFTLTPVGEGTRIAWRMEGTNNFAAKAASLVMDMDEMVGGKFDQGLADLKALAESEARQLAAAQAAVEAAPLTFEQMKEALGEPTDPDATSEELLEEPAPPGDE
jgi:hypothetical protein